VAATLTTYPIDQSKVHRLPGEDISGRLLHECVPAGDPTCVLDLFLEPRAAIWTRLGTPAGEVDVTVAHTSGNVAQHRDLAAWAAQQSADDASAFIVCDCNSVASDSAQAAIRNGGWRDTYRALNSDAGATADQKLGATRSTTTARIDYVFERTGSALGLQSSARFMNHSAPSPLERSGQLWPSDHYGVIDVVG